jgi:hypothetical protein
MLLIARLCTIFRAGGFTMNLVSLALALTIHASPHLPQLPSPTPGINEMANAVNFAALTQGDVIKVFNVGKQIYTVRQIGNYVLLYNQVDPVILIARVEGSEISIACGERQDDPFPKGEASKEFSIDGRTYTIRVIDGKSGTILAIYHNGKVIFAIVDTVWMDFPTPRDPA